MNTHFARLIAAAVLALASAEPARAAAPTPAALAGTGGATIDWDNHYSGLYLVIDIGKAGALHEHVMNHHGMAYDLYGSYTLSNSTFSYRGSEPWMRTTHAGAPKLVGAHPSRSEAQRVGARGVLKP